MEFSRQEYWSTRLPFPTPGDIPHPGMEPASLAPPALAKGSFITTLGKSLYIHTLLFIPPLIHSFSQPVFIECLLHARHCVRQQGQSNKQKDCPRGAYVLTSPPPRATLPPPQALHRRIPLPGEVLSPPSSSPDLCQLKYHLLREVFCDLLLRHSTLDFLSLTLILRWSYLMTVCLHH